MGVLPDPLYITGVKVHPLAQSSFLDLLVGFSTADRRRRVYHVNVHAMNIAARDRRFMDAINRADLVYCDGAGIRLAARMLGHSIPARLAVMDWLDDLLDRFAEEGISVFLIGDEPGVADACARRMLERHPRLSVAGVHHGFFGKSGPENEAVVASVAEAAPAVLLVGMGMPLQETWIETNLESLHARVLMPVGAAFRWYSGVDRLAPRWVSHAGLEWLYRWVRHPFRLFRRYMIGNPAFLARVLRTKRAGA